MQCNYEPATNTRTHEDTGGRGVEHSVEFGSVGLVKAAGVIPMSSVRQLSPMRTSQYVSILNFILSSRTPIAVNSKNFESRL
jgi:hypothetical protein